MASLSPTPKLDEPVGSTAAEDALSAENNAEDGGLVAEAVRDDVVGVGVPADAHLLVSVAGDDHLALGIELHARDGGDVPENALALAVLVNNVLLPVVKVHAEDVAKLVCEDYALFLVKVHLGDALGNALGADELVLAQVPGTEDLVVPPKGNLLVVLAEGDGTDDGVGVLLRVLGTLLVGLEVLEKVEALEELPLGRKVVNVKLEPVADGRELVVLADCDDVSGNLNCTAH